MGDVESRAHLEGSPRTDDDWAARAAGVVDDLVSSVYDRAIRPLMLVARGLVFGIIVGSMGLVLSMLGAITLVRVLDDYAFGHRVWAADATVGGVFSLIGVAAWSKRRARGSDAVES